MDSHYAREPVSKEPFDSVVGIFGRLKPGVSMVSAETELVELHQRVVKESPAGSLVAQIAPLFGLARTVHVAGGTKPTNCATCFICRGRGRPADRFVSTSPISCLAAPLEDRGSWPFVPRLVQAARA